MCISRIATLFLLATLCLAGSSMSCLQQAQAAESVESAMAEPGEDALTNESCLTCHGKQGFAVQDADGNMRALSLLPDKFEHSVHGARSCIDCHSDVTAIPHGPALTTEVNCVSCHDALWNSAIAENTTEEHARLGVVVEQIDHYLKSVHARTNREDQSRVNANCYDCHDPHYIYPKGSAERNEWRLSIPEVCGSCHASELDQYATSIHGRAVLEGSNAGAAICSDCHTTHDVMDANGNSARLTITKNCGNCHADSLDTYTQTYHGQVNTLGYAYTAKCFDCHGAHDIQAVDDPASRLFPANRLQTCQKCHAGATEGFASFEPHGTARNFAKYPYIWIASKLLLLLIAGTLVFFWSHAALWLYREYKERKDGRFYPLVRTGEVTETDLAGKQYQRFGAGWRLAHLIFAISLMMLALTGMSVLFADSHWAPVVVHWLGGPKVAAVIHRTFAVLFVFVFLVQLIYFAVHLISNRGTFEWFGPDSLAPRLQDFKDIIAMFKWFTGLGPRPVFDRWTYWQKFDYWAPFATVVVISICGLLLWFSNVTASFLPGWVFNVATVFHGELAVLALLFLITVHFFNNHFRPDKFPLDLVMFTGSMPLEEFKRTHRLEYNRLVTSGELERHLVDAPLPPMRRASRILGFALIAFSLLLLVLLVVGMFRL